MSTKSGHSISGYFDGTGKPRTRAFTSSGRRFSSRNPNLIASDGSETIVEISCDEVGLSVWNFSQARSIASQASSVLSFTASGPIGSSVSLAIPIASSWPASSSSSLT